MLFRNLLEFIFSISIHEICSDFALDEISVDQDLAPFHYQAIFLIIYGWFERWIKVNLIKNCKNAFLHDKSHVNEINVFENIALWDNASAEHIIMKKNEDFKGKRIVSLIGPTDAKVKEITFEDKGGIIELYPHRNNEGEYMDTSKIIINSPDGVAIQKKKYASHKICSCYLS